jgi:hypothetical protein
MKFDIELKILVNREILLLKHELDCPRQNLQEELYKWCKDYERNIAECETVIESLLVNGEEDYKERVLELEVENFMNFPIE